MKHLCRLVLLALGGLLFCGCETVSRQTAVSEQKEAPQQRETPWQTAPPPRQKEAEIPALAREPRSDWLNVREHGVIGDGVADDTAALQAIYARVSQGQVKTVYFPPGTYRLTDTLTLAGDVSGIAVLGHGRDTVLVWDGAPGGSMYWSNGVHRSRFEGLTYDGRGRAGIGSEHRSMGRYETHIIYRNCAFKNLEYGVAVSKNPRKAAAAEVWYDNCLFQNNGTGVLLNRFNDYDHWFTGCLFVDNGIGVHCSTGHFNIYHSHFLRSREVDVKVGSPCHPPSLRWCTSKDSHRFFEMGGGRHTHPVALQNNHVDGWTAEDGAIRLGRRGPDTIFDCVFTRPPNAEPPIRLVNTRSLEPFTEQLVVLSNNRADESTAVLDPGPFSRVTEIPPGERAPLPLDPAALQFWHDRVDVSGKVFDAKRDFGAVGDNAADDTEAIRQTIAAARAHGRGAVAYLPRGHYRITDTIEISGADYVVEGTGFGGALHWDGPADGVMIHVVNPRHLRLEHLQLTGPEGVTRIRQTGGAGKPSTVLYNNLHVTSVYDKSPGIELVELPANAEVRMGIVAGFVRVVDSGPATIFGIIHVGRLQVEGARRPKTGFLGFLYHNTATHDYVVLVKDNQDLVIGDLYHETNDRFLLAEGGQRSGPGHITIGLSKSSTREADTVHVRDYEGRIALVTGSWQNQSDRLGGDIRLQHRGSRPLDLLMIGNAFAHGVPVYDLDASARLIAIENALWESEKARSFDNEPPGGGLLASPVFDDFRQLGQVSYRCYQP